MKYLQKDPFSSKPATENYRRGYDAIDWSDGKKEKVAAPVMRKKRCGDCLACFTRLGKCEGNKKIKWTRTPSPTVPAVCIIVPDCVRPAEHVGDHLPAEEAPTLHKKVHPWSDLENTLSPERLESIRRRVDTEIACINKKDHK